MKNKSWLIILIVVLSIIAISLTTFMILLLNNKVSIGRFRWWHTISEELVVDETFDTSFNEVNITSKAADIHILASTDNKVRVMIYGDKDKTSVEEQNGVLKIKSEKEKCIGICFNDQIAKIEVYLPTTYSENIMISSKYGDIEISEFEKANMTIEEDAGDITVDKVNVANIKNNYGDITVKNSSYLIIKESAGDIKIGTVKGAVISNNYGDTKLENVTEYIDIDEDCGDIKIDNLNIIKNSKIENSLGDITIGNTNEIYIDANTNLGNIKINNNYNKSDITLTIKNDCGDIKVKN